MHRLFLTAILVLASLSAQPLKVDVSATSAILMNADTGAILYEKEANVPCYPASITKIATALYVLEKRGQALDELATTTHDSIAQVAPHIKQAYQASHPPYRLEIGGTNIGLRKGDMLSLRILLYGLLLCSGNDAANVIANHVSGDVDRFVQGLNQYLREKNIRNTRFLNPHGLHHPDHRTTAYDMALITKEAMKHPFFRQIVKTTHYNENNRSFIQGNRLLKSGQFYYPKAIGVKTGYTSHAGSTLVAAATHENRTLIAVLLNCSDGNQRYRDAIKLFEIAFKEPLMMRTLFTKDHDHFSLNVKGATSTLEAVLGEDLKLSYYPAEEPKIKPLLKWDAVRLPIQQGQAVGKIELVTDGGKTLKTAPLFATKNVDRTLWKALIDFCAAYKTGLILALLGLMILLALSHYSNIFSRKKMP